MGVMVLKNAYVLINAVNLSAYVRKVTIDYGAEIIEKTAMSANSKQRIAGLKDWSADIEFNQDYAAGAVDATLFPLVGAAAFTVEVRADAGARSTTNPAYTGNGVLEKYPPLDGSVGQLLTTKATIQGDGDMSRLTA